MTRVSPEGEGGEQGVRETANEEDEERGESLPLSTMNSIRNPVLPVSDPPLAGENDSDGKGVDGRLFKGSAMTKRGAYAALSYMACAGNFPRFHLFWNSVRIRFLPYLGFCYS